MKNILKLIRRFIITLILSFVLLLLLNIFLYGLWIVKYVSKEPPMDYTFKVAGMLKFENGKYTLPDEMTADLKKQNIWAILIDNDSKKVIWQTDNLPNDIPKEYSISDIAIFSHAYIKNYPVFTSKVKNNLLVLGYPKNSYWKHPIASWKYGIIKNIPKFLLVLLCLNIIFIFLIYFISNSKLLSSVNPIIKGIQNLPKDMPVYVKVKGVLSELA